MHEALRQGSIAAAALAPLTLTAALAATVPGTASAAPANHRPHPATVRVIGPRTVRAGGYVTVKVTLPATVVNPEVDAEPVNCTPDSCATGTWAVRTGKIPAGHPFTLRLPVPAGSYNAGQWNADYIYDGARVPRMWHATGARTQFTVIAS